jgi:hypothetical protein
MGGGRKGYQGDGCQGDRDDRVGCKIQRSQESSLKRYSVRRRRERLEREGRPEIELPERLSLFRLTHLPRASGKNPTLQVRGYSRREE